MVLLDDDLDAAVLRLADVVAGLHQQALLAHADHRDRLRRHAVVHQGVLNQKYTNSMYFMVLRIAPSAPLDAGCGMEIRPSLIMIQFLQWVADRPRRREDVMEAWRSSCPRFPVWEDARAEGLVRQCGGETGERRVELTERGRTALQQALAPH